MQQHCVEWQSVTKTYRTQSGNVVALDRVSLAIAAGECIGLSGRSGSGKTTLLNVLGFCAAPDSGVVRFRGEQIPNQQSSVHQSLRRTSVGFIFQYFNLLPGLTALENVTVMMLLNRVDPANARVRAEELLKQVSLGPRAHHYPHQLSGGEMQRVAVCRALAHNPALILADEPTGNLDSAAGSAVLELLESAVASGVTCVIASHSREVLSRCHRILALQDGMLREAE